MGKEKIFLNSGTWWAVVAHRALFVFFFLALIPNNAFCYDFNLDPIKINFNGSVATKSNIIVYGDFGAYFISTDKGKSWEKRSVGIYKDIFDLQYFNDTLWGIVEDNYVIVSADEGFNWKIYDLNLPEELIVKMIVDPEYLFFRGKKTIYKTDHKLKIIKAITSDTLAISLSTIYEYNQDFPLKYKLRTYLPFINFFFWKGRLIVNSYKKFASGYSKIIEIDPDLNKINLTDFIGKMPFKNDSMTFGIDWFAKQNGRDLVSISGHIFYTDSSLSNLEYFFNSSNFLNYLDSTGKISNKKDSQADGIYYYSKFFNKNELYGTYFKERNSQNPTSLVYLKKYVNRNGKDTFEIVGTPFRDIYYFSSVFYVLEELLGGSRYNGISKDFGYSYGPPRLNIFFDSVVVFSSFRNIFLFSTNLGQSWQLFSAISGTPKYILNDTFYLFTNVYCQSIPSASSFDINRIFHNGSSAPLIFFDTLTGTKSTTYASYYDIPLFYLDSTGFGFAIGNQDGGISLQMPGFFMVTYNNWQNFNFRTSQFYLQQVKVGQPPRYPSNLCRLDTTLLIAVNDTSRIKWNFYVYQIWIGDTSLVNFKKLQLDTTSNIAIIYIMPRTVADFDAICIWSDPIDTTQTALEIRRTQDTGHTWTVLHRIYSHDWGGQISQIYELNKDSIFITLKFPDRVYLYDRIQDKLQLLWKSDSGDYRPLLMILSGKFYLVGRGLYLENSDRNDLTRWWKGHWDYGKPNFESVIFRGNVAIAGLSDSLRPFNYYKITLKKQEPSIVKEPTVEKRYYTTHFWASEPYPQPAKVRVKARVAWDGSFDLQEAIDGVYDTMGRKVEGKERIRVDARSTTSGELEWECSGVPAGIYFILIRWSGGSETVPVVVE